MVKLEIKLTPAEQRVFDLKMKGLTNKAIAVELGYSLANGRPSAVEKIVNNVMLRTGATNAMHLGYLLGKLG